MEVIPSGAALGAELRGLDIAAGVGARALQGIQAAWAKHLVLVVRDQHLHDPEFVAFSRLFGELDPPGPNPYGKAFHEHYPELNIISNIVEDGVPRGNLGAGEAVWHADMTYVEHPPKAALLYAIEIPPSGGDTFFANMYAAYDALAVELKERIDGLSAIHDASRNSAGMLRKGYAESIGVGNAPGACHPLVRRDPESGRCSLFLGRRPGSYVTGLEVDEGEALLDRLWAHATEPRFTMCHRWRVGDMVMWNNFAVLHRRDAFDAGSRRRLHRAQIKGGTVVV
ncbi:MAG: TauD/TfdA family dioxygenase [Lysobacterales bacterium]|nr:MAG: TauD/TfdA family dioxygenase [Xanthomonadales bacterium]